MNIIEQRNLFEKTKNIYEAAKLTFHGIEGYDVYNTSIPFKWNDKEYLFGRVERRSEWARSWVRLFENTGKDDWTLSLNTMIYQLEDPYISIIDDCLVLGGTHVRYKQNKIDTYYGYFYKGKDIHDLYYFTSGPDYMKDIRLVKMKDNKIGVFSRPRNAEIHKEYGSESVIGFTIINNLDELTAEVVENAPIIENIFENDEWGGCNQCYCLENGLIGVIGHKSYKEKNKEGIDVLSYVNISFILDPIRNYALDVKIIGSRSCYPSGPAKKPNLIDCAFTSGIVFRNDGKVDLYSGIGDAEEGRIVIDNPFKLYKTV